jgi:hypothetical protein
MPLSTPSQLELEVSDELKALAFSKILIKGKHIFITCNQHTQICSFYNNDWERTVKSIHKKFQELHGRFLMGGLLGACFSWRRFEIIARKRSRKEGKELCLSDIYQKFGSRLDAINDDLLLFLVKREEDRN